jgi:hypothetical protein
MLIFPSSLHVKFIGKIVFKQKIFFHHILFFILFSVDTVYDSCVKRIIVMDTGRF